MVHDFKKQKRKHFKGLELKLIMKKYLLPQDGSFYKANLHCHSTVSDGELTPQQIKELYAKNGYSIVAFTDHNHFVAHNDLSDEHFLALNGVENAADEKDKPGRHNRCCDICYICLDKSNNIHPLQIKYNIEGKFDFSPLPTDYTSENINAMIKRGRENNFFVTYNHPTWSMESFERYMTYNGMHAMEIFNFSSSVDGYNEYNPDIYDDMLKSGKRIFCIATDDNHNRAPGTCHWDSFGGFTMIKADDLKYESVARALKMGNFYSSRGPIINALWIDTFDNSIHIECEKAVKIVATRANRRLRCIFAKEEGKDYLTHARLSINPDDIYFRLTIFDEFGNTADTNAYFIDELGLEFNENTYVE